MLHPSISDQLAKEGIFFLLFGPLEKKYNHHYPYSVRIDCFIGDSEIFVSTNVIYSLCLFVKFFVSYFNYFFLLFMC